MLRPMLLCLTLAATELVPAAAQLPQAVTGFVHDQTLAIIRVDLEQIDVAVSANQIAQQMQLDERVAGQLQRFGGEQEALRAALVDAGFASVYAVVSLDDLTRNPTYVFPTDDAQKADQRLRDILQQHRVRLASTRQIVAVDGGVAITNQGGGPAQAAANAQLARQFAQLLDQQQPIAGAIVVTAEIHRIARESLPDLPQQLGGLTGEQLADAVQTFSLGLSLPPDGRLSATLTGWDQRAVEALLEAFDQLRSKLPPPLAEIEPARDGATLNVNIADVDATMTPILQAVTRPLLAASEGAMRQLQMNALKQLGLAFHNYHAAYGHFPPFATVDENGNPLLSWRVHVLPFIEQKELYERFHLDEPWDSEHNKALLDEMPELYATGGPLADSLGPGMTRFVMPLMPGSLFGDDGPPKRIRDIADGTSNTILLVQTTPENAVPWTKPAGLELDPENPKAGLMPQGAKGVLVVCADGSARFISRDVDPAVLKGLLTYAGKEMMELD